MWSNLYFRSMTLAAKSSGNDLEYIAVFHVISYESLRDMYALSKQMFLKHISRVREIIGRGERGNNCWGEVLMSQNGNESRSQAGIRPSQEESLFFPGNSESNCQLSINTGNEIRSSLSYSSCCKGVGHYLSHFHSNQVILFLWAGFMSYSFLIYTHTWYSK